MKKILFAIWCIFDLPVFYLLFFLLKELLAQVCKRTVLDFIYCLFVLSIVVIVQIKVIIRFLKNK